jgi:hypothetical protein
MPSSDIHGTQHHAVSAAAVTGLTDDVGKQLDMLLQDVLLHHVKTAERQISLVHQWDQLSAQVDRIHDVFHALPLCSLGTTKTTTECRRLDRSIEHARR